MTSSQFKSFVFSVVFFAMGCVMIHGQEKSVARIWNEVNLEAIRKDFARPTVHARNLFHISAAMYDAWSVFDSLSKPYFLNQNVHGKITPYRQTHYPGNTAKNRNKAISYAAFRILHHRYEISPGYKKIKQIIDSTFTHLGYDPKNTSLAYWEGDAAALGNYIAQNVIDYGWQDGANENYFYVSLVYEPVNNPLILTNSGAQNVANPNRWQPLAFEKFIDQSGNEIAGTVPEFLGPEWGLVNPFSLNKNKIKTNDRWPFPVFFDPGPPPELHASSNLEYIWNHSLVSIWGSHLDPDDGVMWDISPGNIGNLDIETQKKFPYEMFDHLGGDQSKGYKLNPFTGKPYEKNFVPRGDYTRVIAEFWADGPDSETPPGHWYTILNQVVDHPHFQRKFAGKYPMSALEWDVKSYFTLGGALHDAAIAAWSIKGLYDYVRPITAIRYMADLGQSSNQNLPRYHPNGIKLMDGFIELVNAGDDLAGKHGENINKIKLFTWRGHDYIENTKTDYAKVGWILAENWWPYQRPTFVTPNFAGYVSGHSTFSRAAAEVLTLITGSPFFPGGIFGFTAKKNEFLVFEEGPSQDIEIQWATYRDASNQCSLSRIWGGIHPPVDDIPGRFIGDKIGKDAFKFASKYFLN